MINEQTYEDYIKLQSIFELEPSPTPEEIEGYRFNQYPEWALQNWRSLSDILFMRGHKEHSIRAKGMLKASKYFLSLLEPLEQKTVSRLQFEWVKNYLELEYYKSMEELMNQGFPLPENIIEMIKFFRQ